MRQERRRGWSKVRNKSLLKDLCVCLCVCVLALATY